MSDEAEIRQLLGNWVIWRDSGDWERFATLWHPKGQMVATWSQAAAADFIERSRLAFDRGRKSLHSLGGSVIEINGHRALAQSKMQIAQRALVDDVLIDLTCYGRFFDLIEKFDGRWRLLSRQAIYELDQIAPVDRSKKLHLDAQLLASFPEGYRHLGYVQTKAGFNVSRTLPGTRGPEIEALMQRGQSWLYADPVT